MKKINIFYLLVFFLLFSCATKESLNKNNPSIDGINGVIYVYDVYHQKPLTIPDNYVVVSNFYLPQGTTNNTSVDDINNEIGLGSIFATLFKHKSEDGVYLIAFRGTVDSNDVMQNLKFSATNFTPYSPSANMKFTYLNPKVHNGFLTVYLMLREQIMQQLATEKPKKLIVSGHSLGSAIATLFIYDLLLTQEPYIIDGYLYGSPRVGNADFVNNYYKLLRSNPIYNLQVINNVNDVITTLPPDLLGYQTLFNTKYIDFNNQQISQNKIQLQFWHSVINYSYAINKMYDSNFMVPDNFVVKPVVP